MKPQEYLLFDAFGMPKGRVSCAPSELEANTPPGLIPHPVPAGTSHKDVRFRDGELVAHPTPPREVLWHVARRRAFLALWDQAAQLEALHDAANGDRTKLERMNADFDEIRAAIPKAC